MKTNKEDKKKPEWSFYGAGSYNDIFLSTTPLQIGKYIGEWIFKVPKTRVIDSSSILSEPERFFRKYSIINPGCPIFKSEGHQVQLLGDLDLESILDYVAYLYLNESENICVAYLNNEGHMEITILDDLLSKDMRPVYLKHILDQTDPKDYEKHHILDLIQVNKPGVIIPYFGNTQASDTEIALKVLEIYRKSRNIIADATVRGNFLRYRGRTICVDLDCALQRGSIASDTFMSEDMREQFEELWNKEYDTYPCTTDLIQTLFYLEEQLNPDEITDEYLTSELVGKFNMCRYNKIQLSILNIQTLMEIIQYCPENNNNDLITLSLLKEIQSSTDQDRRKVILDAFSREGSFELAFFERWAMNNPLEIDELIAMGRDTACPFGFFQPNSSNQTDAVIKKARTQSPA